MSEHPDSIEAILKEYILEDFLPGEDPDALKDDTPLISGGILDSIATIKFATFIDERFGVDLQAHELSADYIDTLSDMAALISSKLRE